MNEFIQYIINGLSIGGAVALVALGYTMVFGILQFINFAHGEIFMIGAFSGFYLHGCFGAAVQQALMPYFGATDPSSGEPIMTLSLAIAETLILMSAAMLVCAIVGFLVEQIAYRPMRGVARINVLITAIGVSLFFQYAGQLIFGPDPKAFPDFFEDLEVWKLGEGLDAIRLAPVQVVVLVASLGLMIVLHTVIYRSRLGRAMRAVSFNHETAALMGIPTNQIIAATFVIGSALAGAAGVLVGLSYTKIDPLMGAAIGLKAFSAAVLGGIGNVNGAVLGAFVIGMAEAFLSGYLSPSYRDALAFSLLILILIFRPSGLLGVHRVEKV